MRFLIRALWVLFFSVVAIVVTMWLLFASASRTSSREFKDLPGPAAHAKLEAMHLTGVWPVEIEPEAVARMSMRTNSSFDSSSTWYRIRLQKSVAQAWEAGKHKSFRDGSISTTKFDVEGVQRQLTTAFPDFRTGEPPAWWDPQNHEFMTTEVMSWHKGYGSGCYSTYDAATDELWVYTFSEQHALLWQRGQLPEGDRFTTSEPGQSRD